MLDLFIDEIVEGVDVLPNQTLDLEECRNKFPLFRNLLYRGTHLDGVYSGLTREVRPKFFFYYSLIVLDNNAI